MALDFQAIALAWMVMLRAVQGSSLLSSDETGWNRSRFGGLIFNARALD